VVGRFLSVDPVGPAVGNPFNFNRYDYANNNPAANIDPFGRTCTSSVTGRYNCTVDENKGNFSRAEIAKANKAYTSAVNTLIAHSGRNVSVSVDGKSFKANAGQIAKALIKDTIVTAQTHGASPRAKTLNGGIQQAYTNQRLQPITTIYSKDLYENRHQGTTDILRDLSLTFIHEGIHLLGSDAKMAPLIKADPNKFRHDHQAAYDNASSKLYGSGP
jgi:hypothetical protein